MRRFQLRLWAIMVITAITAVGLTRLRSWSHEDTYLVVLWLFRAWFGALWAGVFAPLWGPIILWLQPPDSARRLFLVACWAAGLIIVSFLASGLQHVMGGGRDPVWRDGLLCCAWAFITVLAFRLGYAASIARHARRIRRLAVHEGRAL